MRNLCKREIKLSLYYGIDLIGAVSHDSLYKVFKLVHNKCFQPLSQINQTDSHGWVGA
jgi:hypothetical protein